MFLPVSCTMSGMTSTEWKRLADRVIRRRTELGMHTTIALAEATGLTSRALGDIENARRTNYTGGTKAQIEIALKWQPGSIDAILRGGEATPTPDALVVEAKFTGEGSVSAPLNVVLLSQVPTLELVDEIRRRVVAEGSAVDHSKKWNNLGLPRDGDAAATGGE